MGWAVVIVAALLASGVAFESRNLYTAGAIDVPWPASACESVLVVGLRGNGDGIGRQSFDGLGGDTHAVIEHLTPRLEPASYGVVAFPYDTGAWHQVGGYMRSGARALVAWLSSRATQCPLERWVLIGQSEGAGVLHLSAPELSSQVAAVILLADPLRVAGTAYDRGDPGADGLLARYVLGPAGVRVRDNVPPAMAGRFWSYCLVDDPVCDTAPLALATGLVKKVAGTDVHTSYRDHAAVLELAARFAASAALSPAVRAS